MSSVSIRLPEEVSIRLQDLAQKTGRSKTYYITQAICEHMDDLEDLYLAEQRLTDIQLGKTETLPLEDMMKQYGLEN